jgi:hypothetical protein
MNSTRSTKRPFRKPKLASREAVQRLLDSLEDVDFSKVETLVMDSCSLGKDVKEDIIETEGSDLTPLASGHFRINVPALFRKTYGRDAHPIADHARLVLFTNRLADFMNQQAHRWRHRLMTPKHLDQLRGMLIEHATHLRNEGV